jgi:hypothetical protein
MYIFPPPHTHSLITHTSLSFSFSPPCQKTILAPTVDNRPPTLNQSEGRVKQSARKGVLMNEYNKSL